MIRLIGWLMITISGILSAAYLFTPDMMERHTILMFTVAAFALGDVILLLTSAAEGREM